MAEPPPDEAQPTTPTAPSWRRRMSGPHIPIPSFRPNIPHLRAALLGYIGELEVALRNKLGDHQQDHIRAASLTPSMSTEEWTASENDEPNAFTSALAGPSSGIRQRGAISGDAPPLSPTTSDGYINLLNHLYTLREEASNFLPTLPSVPHVPMPLSSPNREWLRSLPLRLSAVDPGFTNLKGKLRDDLGDSHSVEGARQRMMEVAKALLPSEDWAGWEKLGWEEQDDSERPAHRRTRSASAERSKPRRQLEDDDDDDEPEYLFPNRTPASTRALARRRAVRSKSVGATSLPPLNLREKLQRSKSEVYTGKVRAVSEPGSGDEDEDDIRDHEAAEDILDEAELEDTDGLSLPEGLRLGPTVAEALKQAEGGEKLITFEDLPPVWRNNEHIWTGYRFIPLHLKTGPVPLLKSAFRWHNETINIHSHSIPTLFIFCIIPLIIYRSPLPDPHFLDTAVIVLYLLAASSCMSSSAGWHILSGCASRKWFEWGACVDYIGISWLIAASFGTVVYNGFYCSPKATIVYCSTNLFCGALGSYLPFQRWFNERRNKHLRISFFLFLCVAMFTPIVHMILKHGWHKASSFIAPFTYSLAAYAIGLIFYAFHFPECKWPGKFDTFGASHQIWHAGIVIAIILHYRAIFIVHDIKHEYSCALPGNEVPLGLALERMIGWA
ncbi:hypothetical protein I350_05670 [Cryptococcus amylolentus CBS 6273]|uniref:Uncharacterized protein n=1 Tax=Cryptococcus amylolentus CBS 6273 TaxID=1296118 RepID=A0A1E3JXY8_9TREE|nr:hypothetical protein I350_05670 [Cryptococcus amylolentus CBS 6273]